MTLDQFVEKIRSMVTNPNVFAVEGNTVYVLTNSCELLALELDSLKQTFVSREAV
jgi:hypothetical protein